MAEQSVSTSDAAANEVHDASILKSKVSRRTVLQGAGAAGAAAAVAGLTGSAASASTRHTRTRYIPKTTYGALPGLSASEVAQIAEIVGVNTFTPSGKGMKWKIGTSQALSSAIATFGIHFIRGIYIGIQHVKALGGPDIQLDARDIGLYNPQLGIANALSFHEAGIGAVLDSYEGDGAAELPYWTQFKILALDPSNGDVPQPGSGQPYFFGARAPFVVGCVPGVVKFIKSVTPKINKVAILYPNVAGLGPALESAAVGQFNKAGITSTTIPYTSGQTDWSAAINAIRSANVDFVICEEGDFDAGYFMRQYAVSGIGKPALCFEYNTTVQQVAGSALEGTFFTHDYFTPSHPSNEWQALFTKSFEAKYHYTPDYYPAGYYEDTFILWRLLSRVLAKKGNPNNGTQLLNAFLEDGARYPSVFGGSGNEPGVLAFSTTTHQTSIRPMIITQIQHGKEVPVASFGMGGSNYKLLLKSATKLK